jgi:hypothetical protein
VFIGAVSGHIDALLKRVLPTRTRTWINRALQPLEQRIHSLNRARFLPPAMNPETRAWLHLYYRVHNQKLSKLLNRDLSHWK